MERKIDLKSNGIMPEQIVYDTHTNSLQLNYPPPIEFKIGDKVRLKKNLDLMPGYNYGNTEYTPSMNSIKDAILTVERISNSTGSLDCTNNINNDWWWYKPEWLEHVTENPGPKFKIGDKVIVKNIKGWSRSISENTFVSTMRQFIGNTYTINHVFDDGDVRLEGCGSYIFSEEWLETPLENSIRRYKVGDVMQCIDHPAVFILGDFPEFPEEGYAAIAGLTALGNLEFNTDYLWGNLDTVRLATYDEKKVLLNALAKQGKEFNPNTLEIEEIKPKFKRGDILAYGDILLIFDEYANKERNKLHSLWNNFNSCNRNWISEVFIHATDEQKAQVHELLKKKGKKWNKETLQVEDIKKEFKRGDVLKSKCSDAIFILDAISPKPEDEEWCSSIIGLNFRGILVQRDTYSWGSIHNARLATPEEQQNLFDALKKDGKRWNAETLEIEEIVPEFKRGDILTAMKATPDGQDITFVYDEYIIPGKGIGYFKLLCGEVFCCPISKVKILRPRGIKYGFNINNVRYASDKEIEKFDNDLKEIGKKWNRETLQLEDLDINEIVYSVSTACSYLNKPVPDFTSLLLTISNEDFHKYKAQITLQIIREAWNKFDEFVVDWDDYNQAKYFPVFNFDGSIKYYISTESSHISGSCYSFATPKRAIQFGKQFKELFKVALGNDF